MSSQLETFVETNGWKGLYYYAIFPLDLAGPGSHDRLLYQQTKLEELLPVFGWLVPGIVLLTNTTGMNFIGLVLFFALEAALLALLTKYHLNLAWNQVVELWLNLWASLAGFMVVFGLLGFFLGIVFNPDIEWDD